MKTAAVKKHSPAAPDSKAGGIRKPFFERGTSANEELQFRLRVGRRGDRFEMEADRIADRVVDGRPSDVRLAAGITPLSRRRLEDEPQAKLDTEEDRNPDSRSTGPLDELEETAQAKLEGDADADLDVREEPEVEEPVQARADQGQPALSIEKDEQAESSDEDVQAFSTGGHGLTASDEVARQARAVHGGGNPLPDSVRQKMEAYFGADFSGVRIHTDAPAVLLARHLKALAVTRGNDIFFAERKFAPGSRAGDHLLAHELTHTVQQGAVSRDADRGDADVLRLAPDDEADAQPRPEIVEAIRLARGEIGKVNSRKAGSDGKRLGWERLREYFRTAFGGPVVSEQVIDRITEIERTGPDGKKERKDALPSWCGIFTWWAMKKAGIPIPDWKLGAPGIDAMKLRPSGELPRKGDVAIDVVPYNHFAMVTGLESATDAEGKPAKLRRVATVNGNTAGEDNLGGQVQERWDTLSRWDHFLDPVGKMKLADVPLVTVAAEPEQAEPDTAEMPPPEPEAVVAEESPELVQADMDVEAPLPEDFTEPVEPDLTLPPPADTGPAEQVVVIEKVDLSGSSDQATTAFIDATPSAMAASQPGLAPAVDGAMKQEQQELVDNPPSLEVKTSGMVDVPLAGPGALPIPTDTTLGDGVVGSDPGALRTVSETTPQPFRGNAEREGELEKEESGSFWDAFMNFVRGFTSGIRTRDDNIDTSAGDRPNVVMKAEADTARMGRQREEGTASLKTQRDAQVDAFRDHPGQANIQPRKLDESRPVAVSAEPKASIDPMADAGVADYAAAPLPQDVRDAADAKVSKTLTPRLTEARAGTVDAAASRDADKVREIDLSQEAAARLSKETDTAQRKLVVDNRGKVATLQGEGIGEAYEHVNAFSAEATREQDSQRKAIGEHVRTEEGKARDELKAGEKDAEKEKAEGERKAAEKKKELEKEQKKGSWWDRVKNAIKKAVKVITDAIDKVFTAVRNAVKTIIEKAKNAAIGLINRARNWVVNKLNDFRDWAKSKVDKYLKDTFPGLAKRINGAIDSVTDTAIAGVNYVADKAIEGVTALANSLAAALDKILSTFQTALKTAVRVVGAVMQGDFAEALRAAIEGACEIAGIDPKPVFEFFDRAGKAIMGILRHPVAFIKKLFGAVGDGIGNFFKAIKKHLIAGVIGWLTGALSEVNLTGPFEFTPKGVLSIVLQILGVTYENIKARVIRKVPAAARVFDIVEQSFAFLKRMVTEGPGALWDEIKERVTNLKETVMSAIRGWLITTVIKEGIVWLLALTNPASAIVKAVKLVFDLVMFLVERYQQIKDFIVAVYEAVAEVAAGNFAKVTVAVENALARVLPVLISLLASILSLGGIAKQVKNVISTITKPINRAIDWVVGKIVAFVKKLVSRVKAGARKVKAKAKAAATKILSWWKAKTGFKDSTGASHTLYYKGQKKSVQLYVASTNPTHIPVFLRDRRQEAQAGGTTYKATDVQAAETYFTTHVVPAEKSLKAADTGGSSAKKAKSEDANRALVDDLQKHLDHLATKWLNTFFGGGTDFPPPKLPVMADNARAKSFDADFIVGKTKAKRYKYAVKQGTESRKHVGSLGGWEELRGAKLTAGSKYVRMHLLPHKLGGDAVDSNLTPARGDLFNTPFSKGVEQPAIQSSTEGVEANRQPIWYHFEISYWPASTPAPAAWPAGVPYPAEAFPNRIHATWGIYKKGSIDRDKPFPPMTAQPDLPDLAVTPPAINKDGPTALFGALKTVGVTFYFVNEILLGERQNGPYTSKTNMKDRIWRKFGGEREATHRQRVQAIYDAVGTRVTID
jgi:phage-related protein